MKKYLVNPFEVFNEFKILIVGIVLNLIGIALCFQFDMQFIGYSKLDFIPNVTIVQAILQTVFIILSLCLVLFILGKIINSKTRFIDILNSSLVGIIPFYLLTVLNYNNFIYKDLEKLKTIVTSQQLEKLEATSIPVTILFGLFTILVLILSIFILYKGFKTATNCKLIRHKFYFGVGIVIADILSRFLISNSMQIW